MRIDKDLVAASATPLFRAAFAWRDAPASAELPGLEPDASVVIRMPFALNDRRLRRSRARTPWSAVAGSPKRSS